MERIVLAYLHLLALGIGLGAIYARARALHRVGASPDSMQRAFVADSWWGLAALLWLTTGIWRVVAGTEKVSRYYLDNHIFRLKIVLVILVFVLEIWPMVMLIGWRIAARRHTLPAQETLAPTARRLARVSDLQTVLVVATILAAVLMARGYGAGR